MNSRRLAVWWWVACLGLGCSSKGSEGKDLGAAQGTNSAESGTGNAATGGATAMETAAAGDSAAAGAGARATGSAASGVAGAATSNVANAAGSHAGSGGAAPPPSDMGSEPKPAVPFEGEGDPWINTVPKATCGASDKPETGLQGGGGDFSCNLVVHAKINVASGVSHAFYKDCAYVNGGGETTVLDLSDSANPRIATTLTTVGMQDNWESMKVNENRGLLAGYQAMGPVLDVYDVSDDCTHPVRKTSYNVAGGTGHAGQFSPDGTIYYTSNWDSTNNAVDLMDLTAPKVITSDFGTFAHDLFIGKQGTRGYFASGNTPGGLGSGSLVIVDLSDVQARAANAKGRPIKGWNWDDGSVSQYPIGLSYGSRDVVVVSDELGSGNCNNAAKPPYGYAHMFDVTDEMNPTLTAKIMTEGTGPCKDGKLIGDGFFGVGTHYCSVDRLENPRLLACGFFAGGVRVSDIRNPWRPKEIAYFSTSGGGVGSMPRIRVPEQELWVPNQNGTYYVLQFSNGVLDDIVGE
jgi:hypothetical protein